MSVAAPKPPETVTPPPVISRTPIVRQTVSPHSEPVPLDLPLQAYMAGLRKITVDEYHAMIDNGILHSGERVELLDGFLVNKMSKNRPHVISLERLKQILQRLLPKGWSALYQDPITLSTSEPEPDCAVFRGVQEDYPDRHPGPKEIALVIEVAEASLPTDRKDKLRFYAEAALPMYWIINLKDDQVEVYTQPLFDTQPPTYRIRTDYKPGQSVPLTLDDTTFEIPVADILPAA